MSSRISRSMMLLALGLFALGLAGCGEKEEELPDVPIGVNLLKNSSFEQWVGKVPRDWELRLHGEKGKNKVFYGKSSEEKNTENYSLYIRGVYNTDEWYAIVQRVPIIPDYMVTISGALSSKGIEQYEGQEMRAHLFISFYDRDGKKTGSRDFADAATRSRRGTTHWSMDRRTIRAPRDAYFAEVGIINTQTGYLYCDDVELVIEEPIPWESKESKYITYYYLAENPMPDDAIKRETALIEDYIERLGIDVLVPMGGDDTLCFAVRLQKEGIPIVAVPKTMDNDVYGTDYCIGFSTAVTRSVDFITNIRSTAGSHERIAVVELFGRNSGETSLISAYLAFVDRAVISEVPFDVDKLGKFLLEDKKKNPSHYAIMTISEGASFEGGSVIESRAADMFDHLKLGCIGPVLAEVLKERTGEDVLYQQLAYLMRSGAPDSLDRMVATCYGHLAIQLIKDETSGRMVALSDGRYTSVPVETVTTNKKRVDVHRFYDTTNYRPKIQEYIDMPMFLR